VLTSFAAAFLGMTLGAQHAFEPDHLAAVSTLAAEQKSLKGGFVLGAIWGLGHTIALLAVGGSLAFLEATVPARVSATMELAVGVMILGLGVKAVARAIREGREGRAVTHRHGGLLHQHPAPDEHVHLSRWSLATRPLVVGLIHGAAGSGALTALVLAGLPDLSSRLGYIALFGLGSMVGMALLSAAAGVPLIRLMQKPRVAAGLSGGIGVFSTGFGCWYLIESLHALAA
jgi:ABC-type nickel/cobalt efflux system permease component RcnA